MHHSAHETCASSSPSNCLECEDVGLLAVVAGGENVHKDFETVSMVSGVSTIGSKSKKTLRREAQREKKASLAGVAGEPKVKDAHVQCELISTGSISRLHDRLNRTMLKLAAVKGDLAETRRRAGLGSNSSSQLSSDDCSSLSSDGEGGHIKSEVYDEVESVEDEEKCARSSSQDSCLDDTVEVGDVALVKGLQSERGKMLNERYGKIVCYNSQTARFGVRFADGSEIAIRPENLEVGMKSDEMSEEDEQMLVNLQPTPEEVRSMPYVERMTALYGSTNT